MTTMSVPAATGWGESIARRLLDDQACPVCVQGRLAGGCCARCGADLTGPIGAELWSASVVAAAQIRSREAVLHRVPRVPLRTSPATPAVPGSEMQPASVLPAPPAAAPPRNSATLQSVLATAGAGLFAVAAIVFTYFNPDLADRATRGVITGLITLLFLGGAWLLARRRLQFSAEAVGGLGLVFAGLDVHAVTQLAAPGVNAWLTAALTTAAVAGVMLAAALRSGIRIWLWAALVALAITPAMLGYAADVPLITALGHLGVAFGAAGLIEVLPRLAVRFPRAGAGEAADADADAGADADVDAEGVTAAVADVADVRGSDAAPRVPLAAERTTLVFVQLLAVLSALVLVLRVPSVEPAIFAFSVSGVLALIAVHALLASRHLLTWLWSFAAGATAVTAVTVGAYGASLPADADGSWFIAIVSVAAAGALVLVGGLLPLPKATRRGFVVGGALSVLAAISVVPLQLSLLTGAGTVYEFIRFDGGDATGTVLDEWAWAPLIGLTAISAGLALFGVVARRRPEIRRFVRATDTAAVSVGVVVILTLGCLRGVPLPASVAVLAGFAVALGLAFRMVPSLAASRAGLRLPLLVGAHLAIVASVMVAWRDPAVVPLAGVASIIGLTAIGAASARGLRFLHVGGGFAYALIITSTALAQAGVGGIALLCLTASGGLAVAIVATYLPRIGARAWQAVLVVAVVPFGMGVVQVVFERSGWTALSTGLMFVLAASLLLTRRPGLTAAVRTAASAMLVPTLAVVIVCLGAQLLAASASPVTLPIIAVLVALVLPSTTLIRDALATHGIGRQASDAARIAIEASALLTGSIAVGLALVREAAGLGTSFLVLLILGVGAIASALFTGRRYAWWVGSASFTGALWCVWGLIGVDLLEAYLLPPALGAAVVAVVLTARGRRATGLYAAGMGVAITPLLAALVLAGTGDDTVPWRAAGLLAAAWSLLALAALLGRASTGTTRLRRLRALRTPTFGAAGLAGVAGSILGVRIGWSGDVADLHGAALFLACLGVSAVGALALAAAGRGIRSAAPERSRRRTTRWLQAPAALALAAGTWCSIERDWLSIWAMWALMIAYLIAVVIAARAERTTMPPVWFLFALAFTTAIVAWSPRDLRVEWFSLPLGAFLLLAGMHGMRGTRADAETRAADGSQAAAVGERPTLNSWPGRWTGSWALLAPGIVTMMIASIVSTFTDPLTWRAILVMVLALAAILVGSGRRLAAPFLIGLIVLPIENVFVFSVQIGRGIESMPWWITLAVIGAVLLIIAVTAERRTGTESSMAARIRDLR
ncbi:SCO7613 C-terminal domain-containing membrane protein [Microbacterium aurantiacum]|uniref:SCO7613 C-terminal domain-containing membrane protein n=1 Tax=Microbacterium aurantiacum TaxID=162393 RepID=UPI000C80BC80|nr:hypothetical protein [Microbacterium aurantiacum]